MTLLLFIHLTKCSKLTSILKLLYLLSLIIYSKVLFKQFDEKRNDYLEEFDVAKIYEFIAEHSVPTILEFDQKAAQMIFGE